MTHDPLDRARLPVLCDADTVVIDGSLAGVSVALGPARDGRRAVIVDPRTALGREITATLRLPLPGARTCRSPLLRARTRGGHHLRPLEHERAHCGRAIEFDSLADLRALPAEHAHDELIAVTGFQHQLVDSICLPCYSRSTITGATAPGVGAVSRAKEPR